jgi:hypothetical protein
MLQFIEFKNTCVIIWDFDILLARAYAHAWHKKSFRKVIPTSKASSSLRDFGPSLLGVVRWRTWGFLSICVLDSCTPIDIISLGRADAGACRQYFQNLNPDKSSRRLKQSALKVSRNTDTCENSTLDQKYLYGMPWLVRKLQTISTKRFSHSHKRTRRSQFITQRGFIITLEFSSQFQNFGFMRVS